MKRVAAALVSTLTIGLLLGLFALPAMAQYPPEDPVCGVSDSTLLPGQQVTVSGDGWLPGSTVDFTLEPEGIDVGSAVVQDDGTFEVVLTIPDSIGPGEHSIVCTGVDVEGQTVTRNNDIAILAPGGTATTGSTLNVPLWMAMIAALMVAGLVLVVLGRQRQRSGVRAGS